MAEDHILFHCCQLRAGICATVDTGSPKLLSCGLEDDQVWFIQSSSVWLVSVHHVHMLLSLNRLISPSLLITSKRMV